MNCTDLMLDDWVLDTYTGKPMRVQCVNIKVGKGLEPIPITPEILENNGFIIEEEEYKFFCHIFIPVGNEGRLLPVEITIYKEPICGVSTLFKCWGRIGGGMNDIHLCNLLYVHELQHALRLCGIDIEIII